MNVLACCFGDMKSNLDTVSHERNDMCVLFKQLQASLSNSNKNDDICLNNVEFNELLNGNLPINLTTSSEIQRNLDENLI